MLVYLLIFRLVIELKRLTKGYQATNMAPCEMQKYKQKSFLSLCITSNIGMALLLSSATISGKSIGCHRGKVQRNEKAWAFSFLCTFVRGSEKSTERTFAPVALSFRGTFAPVQPQTNNKDYYWSECATGVTKSCSGCSGPKASKAKMCNGLRHVPLCQACATEK